MNFDKKNIEVEINIDDAKKEQILKARAQELILKRKDEILDTNQTEMLQFILANEKYAIESSFVTEVVKLNEITQLPCVPEFITGIINVHGKIISVIDLKNFFSLPDKGITDLNRVVIVKHEGIELGILADEVLGNQRIVMDNLQKSITSITDIQDDYIIGVTKERVIVFDIQGFLKSDKLIINDEI